MNRDEKMWETVAQEHGELSMRDALVTLTALEWADKTMIDKACEWLKEWTYQDCLGVSPIAKLKVGFSSVEELIEAFRKTMEL